jgi:transposase
LKRCQKAASEGKISVFYLDERGFFNVPNVQRAWAPKGKSHAADASVPHRRVNVVGALSLATGQVWHHLHEQTVNRAAVIDLVECIIRHEQRLPLTLVVLNNTRIHYGIDQEKLDDWMINHRLIVMHLPPYSPELNLIKIVWKQTQYHGRRFVAWSKEQWLDEARKLMQENDSIYKISFA